MRYGMVWYVVQYVCDQGYGSMCGCGTCKEHVTIITQSCHKFSMCMTILSTKRR